MLIVSSSRVNPDAVPIPIPGTFLKEDTMPAVGALHITSHSYLLN